MDKTSFEIRQRTDELIKEAISIWRQRDIDDKLEGMEEDPILGILLTATAYESYELDDEIERLRMEIYEEYSKTLIPYGVGGATAATAALQVFPDHRNAEVNLDENTVFSIDGTGFRFIPLLKTKVIDVSVRSVSRLDARRWVVNMELPDTVSDLKGWTFAIANTDFRNLKLSADGKEISLVRPWECYEMPFCDCFSLDTMLYNHTDSYNPSNACMDLFARQNVSLFYVSEGTLPNNAGRTIGLELEFEGITKDFSFGKDDFIPNAVILVNAIPEDVTLSLENPVFRIPEGKQFLHLVRPSDDQIFGNAKVKVRRTAAERFNPASLMKLLNNLINKFNTDYYAFRSFDRRELDDSLYRLQVLTEKMAASLRRNESEVTGGTYILLDSAIQKSYFSIDLHYVVTDAEACNDALAGEVKFKAPTFLDGNSFRQIAPPVPGFSEISNPIDLTSLARYYIGCNDRIVTPADIRVFCHSFLAARYGIAQDLIENVSIRRKLDPKAPAGFSIAVEIVLATNNFIRSSFQSQLGKVAVMMEKMMQVRSTGIYPIYVNININKN